MIERIDGPSMVDVLARRPWTAAQQARVLSHLHCRLHQLAAPEWLPPAPFGTGDRLLHLDLHPLNVLIGGVGPVVIDWSCAARGDPATDVAMSWVLMASGEVPSGRLRAALVGRTRAVLVSRFLAEFDREAVRGRLPEVVEWKVKDENMTAREQRAMWALARPDR